MIWAGTDDGNLQVSKDGGETWTNVVSRVPGVPKGTYVSRIAASNHAAPGGVPIEAAGNIIGAVGISGAATGEQDEACARAGIQAIQFELETANL